MNEKWSINLNNCLFSTMTMTRQWRGRSKWRHLTSYSRSNHLCVGDISFSDLNTNRCHLHRYLAWSWAWHGHGIHMPPIIDRLTHSTYHMTSNNTRIYVKFSSPRVRSLSTERKNDRWKAYLNQLSNIKSSRCSTENMSIYFIFYLQTKRNDKSIESCRLFIIGIFLLLCFPETYFHFMLTQDKQSDL